MKEIVPMCRKKNSNITLLENEYLCPICFGWGKVMNSDPFLRAIQVDCPWCLGDGKLDWIENIVGKREENIKGKSWRPRAITGLVCKNKSPKPTKGMKYYDMDERSLKVFNGKSWVITTDRRKGGKDGRF